MWMVPVVIIILGIFIWWFGKGISNNKIYSENRVEELAKAKFEQWKVDNLNQELELYKVKLNNDYNEHKNKLDEYAIKTANERFNEWRSKEVEGIKDRITAMCMDQAKITLEEWKQVETKSLRQDAIDKSKAVINGKMLEHFVPYMKDFKYNAKDARFLGSPTDLIVFDGLDEGDLKQIVFIEVKTNKAQLSAREKQIRNIVQAKNIAYEEIRVKDD